MKIKKKRLLIIITLILLIFTIFLFVIPAPYERGIISGNIYGSSDARDYIKEKGLVDVVSEDESIIDRRDLFYHDNKYGNLRLKMELYIVTGSFKVNIYDITGKEWQDFAYDVSADDNQEKWYKKSDDYKLVISQEYKSSGIYTIDLSELDKEHTYCIAYFCSDEAMFSFRRCLEWNNCVFKYLYNKIYSKFHKDTPKFAPKMIYK